MENCKIVKGETQCIENGSWYWVIISGNMKGCCSCGCQLYKYYYLRLAEC